VGKDRFQKRDSGCRGSIVLLRDNRVSIKALTNYGLVSRVFFNKVVRNYGASNY